MFYFIVLFKLQKVFIFNKLQAKGNHQHSIIENCMDRDTA